MKKLFSFVAVAAAISFAACTGNKAETAAQDEACCGGEKTEECGKCPVKAATEALNAALETLTIVAYRQPVSRPAIDAIRGVNSEYILRGLLSRGLIEEVGRAETAGRPILYGTTQDFLLYFGLSSLNDLPPFETAVPEEIETEMSILKE